MPVSLTYGSFKQVKLGSILTFMRKFKSNLLSTFLSLHLLYALLFYRRICGKVSVWTGQMDSTLILLFYLIRNQVVAQGDADCFHPIGGM